MVTLRGTLRTSDWWISGDATLSGSGYAVGASGGGIRTSRTKSGRSGGLGGGGSPVGTGTSFGWKWQR